MLRTPRGGAGSDTAPSAGRLVSIGAVLTLLRDEFPEITISKIRFLEAEGLVEPQRTPSGYRKFSAEDIERLSCVLRMQRDHYLPLKVIREQLDAVLRGEPVRVPVPPGALGTEGGEEWDAVPPGTRVPRAELLAAADATEDELAEWESYGLLQADEGGEYAAEDVMVARLVAGLGRFGLEARHLRAMKAAADRDAGLVEQVIAPLRRHRNPQTRAHAEATARELAELVTRLHAALVQGALWPRRG